MSEWISVKDRLPDKKDNYLVWCNGKITRFHHIDLFCKDCDGGSYWIEADHFITHWMPLPEPPEAEK